MCVDCGRSGWKIGGRGEKDGFSSVWRGSIVLSLVTIPVKLYAAARAERTHLHQIHNVCHSRLRQPLYCPVCERQVDRSEVIKGGPKVPDARGNTC